MATSWPALRDSMATILTGVAIAAPVATSIRKVYPLPPAVDTVLDQPCVVVLESHKQIDRYPGMREKTYLVKLRLMVYDADLNRALDILDALMEACVDAFDTQQTMGGLATGGIAGPIWGTPGTTDEGGTKMAVVDGDLTMRIVDTVVFA